MHQRKMRQSSLGLRKSLWTDYANERRRFGVAIGAKVNQAVITQRIDCAGRKLSFRIKGDGPVMVLLHASPLSSASLVPLMEALQGSFCVIAFDTPGYGESEGIDAQSLQDYVAVLIDALSDLAVSEFALYGVATGAQIALELAKLYPNRVTQLYLDGACHFEATERDAILAQYFPSLAPEISGAHLTRTWHIVNALFEAFPWYSTVPADRLKITKPPVAVLHQMAMDYWRAGADYARAYRLAFANEHAKQFANLAVPCAILRRGDSLLLRYTDALIAQPLPDCVGVLDIAPGAQRYASTAEQMRAKLQSSSIERAAIVYARAHAALTTQGRFVAQQAQWRTTLTASLQPSADGAHLLRAWQSARAQALAQNQDFSVAEIDQAARALFG